MAMTPTTKTISKTVSIPDLPGDAGESPRAEAAGGEVVAHLLVGGLDEPRLF